MANKTSRVYVTKLDQGLDTNIASSQIDEKAAQDLLNIRWNEGGIVMKRDGFTDWGLELTEPKLLAQIVSPTTKRMVTIDGATVKSTTTGTWADATVSGGITFTGSATDYTFTQFGKDTGYIWNKVDPGTLFTSSTTTISRNGMMPSAGFSVPYKGYHVASGVTAQPARVYFSTLASSSDFTNDPAATTDGEDPDNTTSVPGATVFTGTVPDVAQFVDINPSDGEPVTMLKTFQDFLIIGKTNSLWSLTMDAATNKPVIQLITQAIGCVSQRSAVNVKNDLYLLSSQGPISLGNERNYAVGLRTNLLGEKIESYTQRLSEAAWDRAVGVFWDHMYILSMPIDNATTNNTTIMLDTRFGGWSIWDNIDARSFLNFTDSENQTTLYFLAEGGTIARKMIKGHYYDNAAGINAYWRSKAIDAGALDVTKRWTYFTLFMRNIGASAYVTIETELENLDPVNIFDGNQNQGVGFRTIGTESWIGLIGESVSGGETTLSSTDDAWRTQPNMEARTFTFEVGNDKPGENFFLAGYSLAYVTLKAYYFDQSHSF